jgi:hypothetical protein
MAGKAVYGTGCMIQWGCTAACICVVKGYVAGEVGVEEVGE